MENIIQLKKVTKKFGGITALNKASLNVKKGEVVGLIGDNGAGKSTLIKTLVGVYSPDEGEIFIRGNKAFIHGGTIFTGAELMATDLRASVSLVLAALGAKGKSIINRIYHLDRGYENIEKKLKKNSS